MYKCEKCGKEFEKRHAYNGHCKAHSEKPKIPRKPYKWKNHALKIKDETKRGCRYCGKTFEKKRSLAGHQTWCMLNPNRDNQRQHQSEKSKQQRHTEETKKLISEKRIEFLLANPDKVPYIINHSSKKSFPEVVFENALISNKISGWEYNFRVGLYAYDFAWPELKIDVEIDGATHKSEKVMKIDDRRDEFSRQNGWVVVRFQAEFVKKNVIECIKTLKKVIKAQKKLLNL